VRSAERWRRVAAELVRTQVRTVLRTRSRNNNARSAVEGSNWACLLRNFWSGRRDLNEPGQCQSSEATDTDSHVPVGESLVVDRAMEAKSSESYRPCNIVTTDVAQVGVALAIMTMLDD
jgi:hypothetical protein